MSDISFSSQPPREVVWGVVPSPVGPLLIGLTKSRQLCRIAFLEKKKPSGFIRAWKKEWPETLFTESPKKIKVTTETPLLLVGTDFQHRVWSALLDIPAGETMTYGELAERIGKKGAARSVGTALGSNPVPYIVPCHRIVASNGLGGFTGNLEIKRTLINREALYSVTG